MMSALYIHIPFCRRKCFYCDFYSMGYNSALAEEYTACLCRQIDILNENFRTIFVGGGTPSVLSEALLAKLFKSLKRVSKSAKEFTVEVNPESLGRKKIDLFLQAGCNRLSIGVQSLFDDKLKKLGRIHSARKAIEAVQLAKEMGVMNISIDLIFGVWGESLKQWQEELAAAVSLPITHVSAYGLTGEKNTPLFNAVKKKEVELLDEDTCARMYMFTMKYLPKKGFFQYEVSSFAKKDCCCEHNLNYWENNSYLGLGPAAVSYINGAREKNVSSVEEYIRRVKNNKKTCVSHEKLSSRRRAKETAVLNIRVKKGIIFRKFKEQSGFDFFELEGSNLEQLFAAGLISYRRNKSKENIGVYLTLKGFLFCDQVCRALLS